MFSQLSGGTVEALNAVATVDLKPVEALKLRCWKLGQLPIGKMASGWATIICCCHFAICQFGLLELGTMRQEQMDNLQGAKGLNEEQKKGGENEAEKSLTSYPLNHRYQNCSTNGEYEEDLGLEDDGWVQEESSESLFSLSIESRKSVSQPEMPDKEEVSSSPLNPFQKDPKTISGLNQFAQSVLNPIENMSHWKTAKAKTPLQQQQQEGEEKENQNLDWKSKEREIIAVDTSLSSWLVGSEKKKTPNSKNSPESVGNSPSDQRRNSAEDKPVLGDWSHQELKAVSKSSSPRCSSDEIPILGTVGSYWKHTGQATDSDSGSSCRGVSGESKGRRNINQIPTPFQTRLESVVQDGKINAASNA
nr:protein JASON-like [Ipomoea batatas]